MKIVFPTLGDRSQSVHARIAGLIAGAAIVEKTTPKQMRVRYIVDSNRSESFWTAGPCKNRQVGYLGQLLNGDLVDQLEKVLTPGKVLQFAADLEAVEEANRVGFQIWLRPYDHGESPADNSRYWMIREFGWRGALRNPMAFRDLLRKYNLPGQGQSPYASELACEYWLRELGGYAACEVDELVFYKGHCTEEYKTVVVLHTDGYWLIREEEDPVFVRQDMVVDEEYGTHIFGAEED